jgi:hypothetical protein
MATPEAMVSGEVSTMVVGDDPHENVYDPVVLSADWTPAWVQLVMAVVVAEAGPAEMATPMEAANAPAAARQNTLLALARIRETRTVRTRMWTPSPRPCAGVCITRQPGMHPRALQSEVQSPADGPQGRLRGRADRADTRAPTLLKR